MVRDMKRTVWTHQLVIVTQSYQNNQDSVRRAESPVGRRCVPLPRL